MIPVKGGEILSQSRLIKDKVDFGARIVRNKEGHSIIIKLLCIQEHITILNVCVCNCTNIYMVYSLVYKQKLPFSVILYLTFGVTSSVLTPLASPCFFSFAEGNMSDLSEW